MVYDEIHRTENVVLRKFFSKLLRIHKQFNKILKFLDISCCSQNKKFLSPFFFGFSENEPKFLIFVNHLNRL